MPLLDTRARRLTEWTLTAPALGRRIAVQVPSAWEDYGLPRAFEGPSEYLHTLSVEPESGKRYWLHCGGASYETRGFVNETPVGVHRGIWDSFSWDITEALRSGENALRLQVIKNGGATYPVPNVLSGFLPYVSCTFGGLWQPVSLFETGAVWQIDLHVRGEMDGSVTVEGELGGASPAEMRLTVYAPDGQAVYAAQFDAGVRWMHEFRISPHPQPLSHGVGEGSPISPSPTPWERGSGGEGILLWHPAHPNLYRLVAEVYHNGALSHRVETEFGLRTVSVDESIILLNGEPFYPRGVLHWGWYLHTHAPNPELEIAERELKSIQLCGFNLLKACLWVPSREYLRLCDRLGITVWLELPLWLPDMNPEQVAQVKREYEAIVKQTRNHPSILLWTLGCELSTRFSSEALGELYELVKQLTGSPLVRDNSGGGECYGGALQEHADFADYHLYGDAHFARTTFRAFLDTLREPAPWLQGEFADHDTQRDFLTLRQTVPAEQLWWLERDPEVNPQGVRWFYETPFVEERMQQEGVWNALPELVQTSRQEKVAYHKLVLETMRSLPQTSGYVVTGLKDTPIATAGVLDERGELKILPESYTHFNADTVLLLDWHRRREWVASGDRPANPDPYNHFGGRAVYPRIAVSHFGAPIEAAGLKWRIICPHADLSELTPQPPLCKRRGGAVRAWGGLSPLSVYGEEGRGGEVQPAGENATTALAVEAEPSIRSEEGGTNFPLPHAGEGLGVRAIFAGLTFLTQLEIALPAVDTPLPVEFEVELLAPSGEVIAANRWRWGIYPAPDWESLSTVAVYDPAERLWGLNPQIPRLNHREYERFLASLGMTDASGGASLLSHEASGEATLSFRAEGEESQRWMLLTTHFEETVIRFVEQGGAALWILTEPTPLLMCERVPFWREAAHRFLPHPLWEFIPRPEYLDERLFAFSTDLAIRARSLGDYPLTPVWQRIDARTGYTHCYLAEANIGTGRLLITTLHFAGHHGDTPITLRYHPAGQYWLWTMLRYLASR